MNRTIACTYDALNLQYTTTIDIDSPMRVSLFYLAVLFDTIKRMFGHLLPAVRNTTRQLCGDIVKWLDEPAFFYSVKRRNEIKRNSLRGGIVRIYTPSPPPKQIVSFRFVVI